MMITHSFGKIKEIPPTILRVHVGNTSICFDSNFRLFSIYICHNNNLNNICISCILIHIHKPEITISICMLKFVIKSLHIMSIHKCYGFQSKRRHRNIITITWQNLYELKHWIEVNWKSNKNIFFYIVEKNSEEKEKNHIFLWI